MMLALVLFFTGLFLSALFSGTETGFYRANRIRLAMDQMEGDRLSKYLLLMGNQPGLFVASTLIGNNIANYSTSLAVVMAARSLFSSEMAVVELVAPVLFAPVLFIYGELLPKQLYYRAPNKMLRLGAPLFLLLSFLFLPVSLLLWALSRLLQMIVRQSPEKMRAAVARKELKKILLEGREAGILDTYQQNLTERFFEVANRPISEAVSPASHWPLVAPDSTVREARDAMLRKDRSIAIIADSIGDENCSYLVSSELLKHSNDSVLPAPSKAISLEQSTPQAKVILRMQSNECELARITDREGKTIGLVSFDFLTESIFESAANL